MQANSVLRQLQSEDQSAGSGPKVVIWRDLVLFRGDRFQRQATIVGLAGVEAAIEVSRAVAWRRCSRLMTPTPSTQRRGSNRLCSNLTTVAAIRRRFATPATLDR